MPTTASRTRDVDLTLLISAVASIASVSLMATAGETYRALVERPGDLAVFVGLTLVLHLLSVEIYGKGRIGVAGIGALAVGFAIGVGPAMATQVVAAFALYLRDRRTTKTHKAHKALFNAATLALAAGAGAAVYHLLSQPGWSALERIGPALAGGAVFWLVNIGLLTLVVSRDTGERFMSVWDQFFRWLTLHYVAFGPLAIAAVIAYERVGVAGVVAFTLPPALLLLSVRQYLDRTKEAVEEVREANESLAQRNEDLQALLQLAGGLAARTHDVRELAAYAEEEVARLTQTDARISTDPDGSGIDLVAGGIKVGALAVGIGEGFDGARWVRVREAVLPQLATAVESAGLVEKVRRQHLATIAALSRSMEAKDDYTGGHVERVSEVAVALAEQLGFSGPDLDAIEIGALLHDIGKIGIPESLLRKPGPLDDTEWEVMRKHPVVSEYILSSVDLPEIVLQIARSSHERIDGLGYPDGLAGEEIPLPARIVLVADALDALTSTRPYRTGRGFHVAFEEIRAHSGTQFCPTVVAALDELYRLRPMLVSDGLHSVAMSVA